MGYAISWYAVREANAEQFLQSLALTLTAKTSEFPNSMISAAKLDTGWRVLWYNGYRCPFLRERDLRRISTAYDVLACHVEEHVMASSAGMWSGGKRKWWLSHEGHEGPKGLDSEGELPGSFPAIQQEMEQRQLAEGGANAGVDYIFEIPLKVAQSLVGFKHDEDPRLLGKQFVELSRAGFLHRLIGK